MEKLLELMNDYAHTYADHYDDTGEEITITFFSHGDQCFQYVCDGSYETLVDDIAISKRFGFISWLVENDKIDTKKVAERREEDGWSIVNYNHYEEQMTKEIIIEYWVDNILMALSISDTPIDDLISYLE